MGKAAVPEAWGTEVGEGMRLGGTGPFWHEARRGLFRTTRREDRPFLENDRERYVQ